MDTLADFHHNFCLTLFKGVSKPERKKNCALYLNCEYIFKNVFALKRQNTFSALIFILRIMMQHVRIQAT